jgi:hypothetical protein
LLTNVYRDHPVAVPGSRLLSTDMGIEGVRFTDPLDARRIWRVESLFMPVPGRAIGGIRAKVRDQKNFISFCNQRDLEVLLGDEKPGDLCVWLDDGYVDVSDDSWVGLVCDEEDLRDDLFDLESQLRNQLVNEYAYYGAISIEQQLERRVHLGHHYDVEDLFVLLGDVDFDTGESPDTSFDNIERRWMRAERRRVRWEKT